MVNLGLRLADVLQRLQQHSMMDPRADELDRLVVRIFAELRGRVVNVLPQRRPKMRRPPVMIRPIIVTEP